MKAIRRKVSWPPLIGCFLVPRIVSLIEPGALTVFSRSIIFLGKKRVVMKREKKKKERKKELRVSLIEPTVLTMFSKVRKIDKQIETRTNLDRKKERDRWKLEQT